MRRGVLRSMRVQRDKVRKREEENEEEEGLWPLLHDGTDG